MFSSEQLVNPSWEPVSFAGLRQLKTGLRRLRLPGIDEALVLFCICLLLLFYISPALAKRGLFHVIFGNQLLLILAPTLLAAWLLRWEWRSTFTLFKPRPIHVAGALLLGIGLGPIVRLIGQLQQMVWPQDPAQAKALSDLIVPELQNHPVFTAISIGLLAGTCEELLFRGPIQRSMLGRLPAGFAIVITALLFAFMHMDLHGVPIRAALGIVLGWVVVRTGSILPAMVLHGIYDTAQLAYAAIMVAQNGDLTSNPVVTQTAQTWTYADTLQVGIGLAAIAVGTMLVLRRNPTDSPSANPGG